MADKNIGSLPQAQTVDDASLFVLEQQGQAMKATGAQWKGFAVAAVAPQVQQSKTYADSAGKSAESAAKSAAAAAGSATEAAGSASEAKEYSGKPPIIKNGTWWTWDAAKKDYVDTGESAKGDLLYATFYIDPLTGLLMMRVPDRYNGPVFRLNHGYLEVSVNG